MPYLECPRCRKTILLEDALIHKIITNHKLYAVDRVLGSRREVIGK